MNNEKRSEYFTRESIMELLSDDEIAKVTTAEAGASLAEGDEYIDLEQLDQGVRTAKAGASTSLGRVLSKKAVQEQTWVKVLEHLKSRRIAPVHSGA
jgi:biopolymer transport protein ExbD